MLFEDKEGKILTLEQVNSLAPWEIGERGIHTFESKRNVYGTNFDYYDEFS